MKDEMLLTSDLDVDHDSYSPKKQKPSKAEKRIKKLRTADTKYIGEEPEWVVSPTDDEKSIQSKVGKVLNWYNQACDYSKARKWLLEYLKEEGFDEKTIHAIAEAPDYRIQQAAGWTARLLLRGAENLPTNMLRCLKNTIEIAKKYGEIEIEKQKQKIEKLHSGRKRVKSAEQIDADKLSDHIGMLEEKTDKFISDGFPLSEDCLITSFWYQQRGATREQTEKIVKWFTKEFKEIEEARKKKDDQLVEAYGHCTDKQLKKYSMFLKAIINGGNEWIQNEESKKVEVISIRKIRRVRVRKSKPAADQVRKLHFKKEDADFGLTSISPTKIVGAQQVWVFNTRYRYLGVYTALTTLGFTVKGSTIRDFDPKVSVEMKLRKPKDVLKKVLDGGKVALRHVFEGIKTKERKLTGRLNEHTIILRAV